MNRLKVLTWVFVLAYGSLAQDVVECECGTVMLDNSASCSVLATIKRLRTELFKNRTYDPMVVPVKNWSNTLQVSLDLMLVKIFDVVSLNQLVHLYNYT